MLLQDLRKINDVIEGIGPHQSDLPSSIMLPQGWKLAVEIKDCFFNIPLHPLDIPRFAFSVPSPNRQALLKQYHWLGSPSRDEELSKNLSVVHRPNFTPPKEVFPEAVILHYMDDVLICAKDLTYLNTVLKKTIKAIEDAGFEIWEDKVQYTCPWTYLGLWIHKQTITPHQLTI